MFPVVWNWAGVIGIGVAVAVGIVAFFVGSLFEIPEDAHLLGAIEIGFVAAAVYGFHYDRLQRPAMFRTYLSVSSALSDAAWADFLRGNFAGEVNAPVHRGTRIALFLSLPLPFFLFFVLFIALLIWAVDYFGGFRAIPTEAYLPVIGSLIGWCVFCYLYASATASIRSL